MISSLSPSTSASEYPCRTCRTQLTFVICRSLIASYLGNIVGALFVGMPAVYMYLADYNFTDTQMKELEAGTSTPAEHIAHIENESPYSKQGSGSSPSHTVQEVYRVESKHS